MKRFFAAVCVAGVMSCVRHGDMDVATVNVRPVRADSAIAPGDCVEARRRASGNPDLEVDRVPEPVRQSPRPFQRMPAAVRKVVRRSGAIVKVDVLVDTLGHADMRTFHVEQVSHPWFAQNMRTVLRAWTFTPAEVAGCKVARLYRFSATSKPAAG